MCVCGVCAVRVVCVVMAEKENEGILKLLAAEDEAAHEIQKARARMLCFYAVLCVCCVCFVFCLCCLVCFLVVLFAVLFCSVCVVFCCVHDK